MKKILLLVAALCALSAAAQPPRLADVDIREAAGNYLCYPYMTAPAPAQTPVPAGYEPFHLEHYGRHGSRWLIGDRDYEVPVALLGKAKRDGKLTPLGERVLQTVTAIRDASVKRDGELSDNGARQHRGIGRRMAENYPQIFNSDTRVEARSTVVIRCILSMMNAIEGLRDVVPDLDAATDASYADMWYMNFDDKDAWKVKQHADTTALREFRARHRNDGAYLSRLISDPVYAADSIGSELYEPLFYVLENTQSHSTQPWLAEEVFTPEEAREIWLARNAGWFLHAGNSRLTEGRMPFTQRNLLRNIVESADTAMVSPRPSANLRFGHDGNVLPLAVLMQIDGLDEEINDLEELADKGWHDYLTIPMAGNIQIVFYRRPGDLSGDDVLVKVLRNEREACLPLEPVSGPYYRWSDVRARFLDRANPHL